MSTIVEKVKRGAEMLDGKRPGWWREINVSTLKVSGSNCILGQLYGGVGGWFALREEYIPDESTASYGLACDPEEDEAFAWAWANEINARYELSSITLVDEEVLTHA